MAAPTADVAVYKAALILLGTAGVVVPIVHKLMVSPILAYLIATVFSGPFNSLAWVLFGNLRPHVGDYGHGVLMALTTYGFAWLFLAYLYRRKVFFRL